MDIFCEICGAQIAADSKFCHQCGMVVMPGMMATDTQSIDISQGKLFNVYSIMNGFRFKDLLYDNVRVNWFVVGRQLPHIAFEDAVSGFGQLEPMKKVLSENYIKERFTLEEAEELLHFLTRVEKIDTYLEALPLPVDGNKKGYRDTSPIASADFIKLHTRVSYNLNFKVEGYFNTALAEQQVMPDERVTVITKINVGDIEKYIKEKKRREQELREKAAKKQE